MSVPQVLPAAFAVTLTLAAVTPAVCSAEPLVIGVLKGDSLVVPVFVYSDKSWNAIGIETDNHRARRARPMEGGEHCSMTHAHFACSSYQR